MADHIGMASGLIAAATFAFQSSVALGKTVKSYNSRQQSVLDLEEEISALSAVLDTLTRTISASSDLDLSVLQLPLRRCKTACQEFEQAIKQSLSRSSNDRANLRDWARVRYMGEDINGFRRVLSGYKMTITIALCDVNL
jgi:hypothetical protein